MNIITEYKKPPITLVLATSTSCGVKCKTCPAGRKEKQQGGIMSLEMMEHILEKVTKEARVLDVALHYYNEPFLIPHFPQMVAMCAKKYGLDVYLSTTLNHWKNVPEVIALEPFSFIISMSGMTQSVYERSHNGGDIEVVKENMKNLSAIVKQTGAKTIIRVSWHSYEYNLHQREEARLFAESLGFEFTPYMTGVLPFDLTLELFKRARISETSSLYGLGLKSYEPHIAEQDIIIKIPEARKLAYERRKWPCILQNQVLAINSDGNFLNCCGKSNIDNLRGSIFDTTVDELLAYRHTDFDCISCKAVGGHVYADQSYTRKQWDIQRIAENFYRKLKLQGMFNHVPLYKWIMKKAYRKNRPTKGEH